MRVNINLATQPYEDARQFYFRWASIMVVLLVLTGGLFWAAFRNWQQTRGAIEGSRALEQQLAQLNRDHAQAEALLDQSGNATLREQSEFLNSQIARKAFSWTQVLDDLEKIVPARVQVVSIEPTLDKDNALKVDLRVTSDSRDQVLDLLRRLEQSQHFRLPEVQSENLAGASQQQQGGANQAASAVVEFDISAYYVPQAPKGAS